MNSCICRKKSVPLQSQRSLADVKQQGQIAILNIADVCTMSADDFLTILDAMGVQAE